MSDAPETRPPPPGGSSTRERLWRAVAGCLLIVLVWQVGNATLNPPRTIVVADSPPPLTSSGDGESARAVPPAPPSTARPIGPVQATTQEIRYVGNTGGEGVYLRTTPRLADRLRAWPDGTAMVLTGPEAEGDGRHWFQVRAPDGTVGWVPSEYLA